MRIIAILLVLSVFGLFSSCKKKKAKEVLTPKQVEVVEIEKTVPVEEQISERTVYSVCLKIQMLKMGG